MPILRIRLTSLPIASLLLLTATALAFWSGNVRAARASDFTFVQISDTHLNGLETPDSPAGKLHDRLREITELKPRPEFIIDTGDITESGTADQFASFQKIVAADLPKSLPLYFAPGNHDVRWSPPAGDAFLRESGQPRYRSFDHGGLHFVLLDSTVPLEHWGHIDQEQLDWLAADLKKTGRVHPVVIGFHHWIGRDVGGMMLDNEDALLNVVGPYNVRLWLLGHGHSNLLWNIDGASAIMTGALFDGSYTVVHVDGNHMDLFRRTKTDLTPTKPFLTIPLDRPASPRLAATANAAGGQLQVTLEKNDIPTDAMVTCRVDDAKPVAIESRPGPIGGWAGALPLGGVVSGVHRVLMTATLPDHRSYRVAITLTLAGPTSVVPKWSVNLGAAVQGTSLCDGPVVYVPTMGGTLFALDGATGKTNWRFATAGCLYSAPLPVGDALCFGSGDGSVYSIDRKTARSLWKTPLGSPILSGLSGAGNILCVACADSRIYGVDGATGKVVWTTHGDGMFQSRPASDGSRFYLGDWGNGFRCLDAATGKELWKVKIGRSFYYSASIGSPSLNADNTLVYVTSDDGVLHALETSTGVERWKVGGPSLGYSGPRVADGVIYNASLTDNGRVFAFDAATGAKTWEGVTGSVIYDSTCVVAGRDVCVGCVDGTFCALHRDTGTVDYQYRLGDGHLLASPVTGNGLVYIGSEGGEFFAFPQLTTDK